MKTMLKLLSVTAFALAALIATSPVVAQESKALQPRVVAPIDDSARIALVGSRASRSYFGQDLGAVDPAMQLHSITIDFSRTPTQQAELDALVVSLQDLKSPLYHQWLSPEQFGARFGLAASDIQAVQAWLQREGFAIERVARGSNHIIFSGTAAQVKSAFGVEIHSFKSRNGAMHFAPASELTVPVALASSIQTVRNVHNYLSHPRYLKPRAPHKGHWTSGDNTYVELGPLDLATIYDVNNAYKAGYTGAGQSIAIVGQSYVLPSDIATFQTLSGVPTAKPPVYVLVPATGTAERFQGDESESDLDVEYSSTIGKGAQVFFVYTGSYQTGVDQATEYAIDEKIAPIISSSYGICEVDDGEGTTSAATEIADYDLMLEQAVAQGQTFLVAAGDDGSTDCAEDGDLPATGESLAVDTPGSSPYALSMGGTGIPIPDYTTNLSTYFNLSTGGVPLANSAKGYIPEVVWNDDDPLYGTSAGGGGNSLYEVAPAWQTPSATYTIGGVAFPTVPTITIGTGKKATTAIPRVVPDISLAASPNDPGMLVCSSDASAWYTGQVGSCVNGFFDSTGEYLTVFGGTSFDGPIFSGMLAILNQALNSTGQGNIGSTLYAIAASSPTVYASAFHDITAGSNACYNFQEAEPGYPAPPSTMPQFCGVGPEVTSYAAGTGYDLASGLGSIDLNNLIAAWPKPASASLLGTTVSFIPATGTPALNTADILTITVASNTGTTVPTGTVLVSVDGVVAGAALPLVSGAVTYSFSTAVLGAHVVSATYSDDATHAASTGLLSLYAGTTTPNFQIAASSATVKAGSSTTSTVTLTPANGYTGLVNLSLTAPASLTNVCFTGPASATVSGAAAATAVFTFYTNANNCPSGATTLVKRAAASTPKTIKLSKNEGVSTPHDRMPWNRVSMAAALAGLLFALSFKRRSRLLRAGISLGLLAMLAASGLGLVGCTTTAVAPSSSTPPTQYVPAAGTYTLTVSGTDSLNPTLTVSTSFTLTVQ